MSVTISRPTRRRPVFHPLPVAAIDRLTDDAVAITFAVPAELREQFAFRAGQHLTVRKVDDDARRSYSICSTPFELESDGAAPDRRQGDPRRRLLQLRRRARCAGATRST